MEMISSKNAPKAIGPYSQAIEVKPFIFTSGQIPLTPNGELIASGIREQTEQVLKNIQGILAEKGLTLQDVVKVTVFMQDLNEFTEMNEVYAQFFQDHKPARSTVEVARLPKDVKIEIECIAAMRCNG
ncbi:RidA family protein [Tepidibacillus fermentans]|uniref:2-iminobutanoate/2-iminopropanoate deaminase n=1 Tax=Tepidibacillus fermentans TaxID=1281767 RepID=A0A4R3KAX9_9BACI|nr:RidA family protein [Tepidibacillus fermentans]TCS80168.1 2-iminobutanoate/2-iminopropanoate deaminase [Tepidibacillus fermentans]